MTDYFHPQPWRTFTTPLTIPHPRSHDAYKQPYPYHPYQPYHTPYSAWRSPTPPSLSPSPSPSTTSTTSTHSTHSNIEIEELENEDDTDSGVELLIGEYEEAPENYGRLVYDSDVDSDDEDADVDIAASHSSILYGFERLNARTSPATGMKGAKGGKMAVCGFPIPRRAKRSYAESEDSSSVEEMSWWGDSGLESEEEGGRRVRRRVVRRVKMDEEDCVSVKSWGEDAGSDIEIDMEL